MSLRPIRRRSLPFVLLSAFVCLAFPLQALARPITVAVLGDSIATELGHGMQALFAHSENVRVIKKTKFSTGLVRPDYFDWNRALREFLAHHDPEMIVVTLGGNDRQNIALPHHRRLGRFSKEWWRNYEDRVDHFMDILQSRSDAKVYWLALPQVRSHQMSHDYRALNEVYRRQAKRHHITYIPARTAYSAYGRGLDGRRQRLRQKDGLHYTDAGGLVLAAEVAHAMGLR
ncbi:MAG TPA: DUF459 domain-containing protein [Pseudolabrys sp.]|nr:DUF459 domain-containing protein [Pseudolabrys sp.]